MDGSLWGLPILVLGLVLAQLNSSLIVAFRIHAQNQSLLHSGIDLFLYAVGAVLLFGGTQLLRASIAPLCLLLCVNPVPYAYNAAVDLPLQFLSANTARHFAYMIGLQPTGQQLRMMFTPNFGMMIVPGCNGVRGSVTLGYLALIFGYIRHLRPRVLALTTLGAFLAGYAFNLLRLCVLVIYYRIGMTHVSIQPYGANVDYGIGCTLFLIATFGVGLFIRWIELKPRMQRLPPAPAARNLRSSKVHTGYATLARLVCFLLLAIVFIVPMLGARTSIHLKQPNEHELAASLPSQVGPYHLVRTYTETLSGSLVEFLFADYATPSNSAGVTSRLTLGIYMGVGKHLVAYSKFAQGVRPNWSGTMDVSSVAAQPTLPVHYVTTLYDDGVSRQYNAETVCYESGCTASIDSGAGALFVSAPKLIDFFSASDSAHLTILVRKELPDSDATPTAVEQTQFESDVRQFTEQLNLPALLHQDGTQN